MSDEETIFAGALSQGSADERAAYLDRACAGDARLRRGVESLLLAHERVAGVLESAAAPAAPATLEATRQVAAVAGESVGATIGPYKLLEQIGEGGMAVVFLAEQSRPIQRKVALKIIKPGMDTRQVVARFEAERQALALMDHANIAKVFDAGTTDGGRPYFVMELVKGVPITRYCDEHRVSPRGRLELFVQVCHAVQHAHQKGIIHRDLKPSNVLVAFYDGEPVPKVIDFGIAKATGPRLTDRTLFTGYGAVVGTPEYMSPEQAELNQLDVDTRSDVYSLGVLLYELLTGSTPLDHDRFKAAALLEMLRVVREEEPPKPSTRLSTSARLPSIAANRGLDPKRLSVLVHGELDWIVMRALEKQRNRRYETPNGLAADVERYLKDEAVQACPPSAAYRFRKFGRRNKVALLASTMVVAALLAGTGVSTWQAVRATRATLGQREAVKLAQANERTANENANKAEAERRRAEGYFYKARLAIANIVTGAVQGRGKWAELPPQWRTLVAANSLEFYESLLDENNPNPAARYETGLALRTIGLVHAQLREHDQAVSFSRRSCDVLDALVRDVPAPREYRKERAYAHLCLGEWLRSSKPEEAQPHLRIAATAYEALLAEGPTLAELGELAEAYWFLNSFTGPGPEADTRYKRLAAYAGEVAQPFVAKSAATRPVAQAHREAATLGWIATYLLVAPVSSARENELALRIVAEAVELDAGTAGIWDTLGIAHYRASDYPAAENAIAKAIQLKDPPSANREYVTAMVKWQQGHKGQARDHYDLGKTGRRRTATDLLQREAAALMGIESEPATRPVK